MAKRIYFGWNVITKKATGETWKLLTVGKESSQWHGMEVRNHYIPIEMSVPDVKVGTMLDVEFDDRGGIEEIAVAKRE